ncbi:uncharacterized protein [Parasteatoda tepidariorum]|uniref:uncharacterized protein isoform X3 n=1 Tax=Parasteatoda tepidariorum TaxID=114398 RepID=UPI0039BCDB95
MFIPKILFVCSITAFLFLDVFAQYRYDCDEHFCSKSVKCRDTECSKGFRLIKNATKCGCCHVCVEQLKEGDACKTQELSVLPRQECGEGLICSQTLAKCVPVESKCTKERRRARAGDVIKCDEFGFYEPVVCKSGVLCYCVNKNGKRIFGTDVASKKELMNCNDKRSHRDDDEMLRSKCWHEQNFLERQIQNYTENGVRVIGAYLPKCDLDGSYAPVQCKKNECYCVKKNGELYHKRKYRVKRTPDNVKNMTCRCIRDHEMLMELRTDEKVKAYLDKKPCDNGEYKNIGVIEIKS